MVGQGAGRHARPSVMRWGVLRRSLRWANRRPAGRPPRALRQGAAAPRQGRSAARGPGRGREEGGSISRGVSAGPVRAVAWLEGGPHAGGRGLQSTHGWWRGPCGPMSARPRRPRFQDVFRSARYVPAVRSTRSILRRTGRRSLLGSTESSPGPNAMIEAIRPARAPRSPVPLLLPVSLRGAARAGRLGRGNPSDPAQARPAHHGELLPATIAGPWGLVRVGRA